MSVPSVDGHTRHLKAPISPRSLRLLSHHGGRGGQRALSGRASKLWPLTVPLRSCTAYDNNPMTPSTRPAPTAQDSPGPPAGPVRCELSHATDGARPRHWRTASPSSRNATTQRPEHVTHAPHRPVHRPTQEYSTIGGGPTESEPTTYCGLSDERAFAPDVDLQSKTPRPAYFSNPLSTEGTAPCHAPPPPPEPAVKHTNGNGQQHERARKRGQSRLATTSCARGRRRPGRASASTPIHPCRGRSV